MLRHLLASTILLTLFGISGAGLVAFVHSTTDERIAANERQALLAQLNAIVPADQYDNDLATDTLTLDASALGQQPVTVYRARRDGEPVAAIFNLTAAGYAGPIDMLVGIQTSGELAGVRVVSHTETPGLGDLIEAERADWILQFEGLSLGNPPAEQWGVKRDGGEFDQFTGATITPRAVVGAIKRALLYFRDHRQALFAQEATDNTEESAA